MPTKTVHALLRDLRNGHVASRITVTIDTSRTPSADVPPQYRASGIVPGHAHALAGNDYLLDLGDAGAGQVSLTLAAGPPAEHTRFEILLQGPEWAGSEWWDKL